MWCHRLGVIPRTASVGIRTTMKSVKAAGLPGLELQFESVSSQKVELKKC
jgi:hypothetical protein